MLKHFMAKPPVRGARAASLLDNIKIIIQSELSLNMVAIRGDVIVPAFVSPKGSQRRAIRTCEGARVDG